VDGAMARTSRSGRTCRSGRASCYDRSSGVGQNRNAFWTRRERCAVAPGASVFPAETIIKCR
jgi:hypothetical protein